MSPAPGIYGWSTGTGGVHFHRMAEPLRVAREHGITASSGQRLDDDVCAVHDTILVHMLWDERNSQAWEQLARRGQHRLVLDVDDRMWAPDAWAPFRRHYTPQVLARIRRNLSMAHVVTTPSEVLAEDLEQWASNVWVVPNSVPAYLTRMWMPDRPRPVLGYQGSPSHTVDFPPLLWGQLVTFLHGHQEWDLHVWGSAPDPDVVDPAEFRAPWRTEPGTLLPGRVHEYPWQASVGAYYRTLAMDIGIGPLAPTRFNAGKSALRAIEYAALGIVAVLSHAAPYRGWVEDGVTGRLVGPGDSWTEILSDLARDPLARAKMSQTARERAASWTTEACITRWVDAWSSA